MVEEGLMVKFFKDLRMIIIVLMSLFGVFNVLNELYFGIDVYYVFFKYFGFVFVVLIFFVMCIEF